MDKQKNNTVLDFLERLRTSDEDLRHKEIPKFDGAKYVAYIKDATSFAEHMYVWDPSVRRPSWADYVSPTGFDFLRERWNATTASNTTPAMNTATTASNTTPAMHTATTTTNVDFIRRYYW